MKVTYVTLDPLRYPRVKKINYSLKKLENIEFHAMLPNIRLISNGGKVMRLIYAIINYFAIMLQIFFLESDIFWVANCPDILVVPLVLRRKPYVLEYRSPWSFEVRNEFGKGPWVYLTAFFENLALKHAWVITLTTSKLMMKVKSFRKPIFVIPNYPLKSFGIATITREEIRKRYGFCGDDKVTLFVGKLTRVEGVDLLPKIMEDVLKKRKDVFFWIVGDGPLYPLMKRIQKRFPRRIKLFGWQPYEQVPSFIAAADVCIVPRHKSPYSAMTHEEGVGKFSEYMFFKKPIVACGVAKSEEYLLVDENDMAEGILKALAGKVPPSSHKIWEDYSEKKIQEMLNFLRSTS